MIAEIKKQISQLTCKLLGHIWQKEARNLIICVYCNQEETLFED